MLNRWFVPVALLGACAPAPKPAGGDGPGTADTSTDDTAGGGSDGAGDGTDTSTPEGPLHWGPVQSCARPAAIPSYVERSADAGFLPRAIDDSSHLGGSSLAVADFDEDGDLDIVQAMVGSPLTAYWSEDGAFRSEELDAPTVTGRLTVEDVNADGSLDLRSSDGIWWQGGTGLQLRGRAVELPALHFAVDLLADDANGDGALDYIGLVSSGSSDPEERRDWVLYGSSTGTPVAASIEGSDATGNAAQGSLVDWDHDGDLDVMVTNDMGAIFGGSRLYANTEGTFTSVSAPGCLPTFAGMAHTFGDYDRDGDEDIFVGGTFESLLLRREGDGGCVDFSAPLHADPLSTRDPRNNPMVWATTFLDFDNDGRLDILATEGDLYHPPGHPGPSLPVYEAAIDLLQQQEDGHFTDVGPALGLAQEGSHRAVVAEDLNQDGLQDLIIADVEAPLRLYTSTSCTANTWLRVEAPAHTKIEVEAGEDRWMAVARTERGVGAAGPSAVHLGLGATTSIDRIVLTPLQGEAIVLEGPFEPRRTLRWTP